MRMINKLASRKFWLAIAAFLASFAAGVTGIADPTICAVCMALSAGIYAACEAYVDGAAAKANQTIATTNITANATSREVVEKAFLPDAKEAEALEN